MGENNPIGAGTKEQLARQYDALESDRQAALEEIRAKKLKDRTEPKLICVTVEYTFSEDHYVEADTYEEAKEIAECRGIPFADSERLEWLETVVCDEWDETYYVKKGDEYVEVNGNSS